MDQLKCFFIVSNTQFLKQCTHWVSHIPLRHCPREIKQQAPGTEEEVYIEYSFPKKNPLNSILFSLWHKPLVYQIPIFKKSVGWTWTQKPKFQVQELSPESSTGRATLRTSFSQVTSNLYKPLECQDSRQIFLKENCTSKLDKEKILPICMTKPELSQKDP